ncbi:MAG TPA: lytic transglycosylase domain-containing protein, partial [Polyangiaceae bacterium]|nr:lytic transglycosylase domain-containing protein [Polyangiaceae bacterium]
GKDATEIAARALRLRLAESAGQKAVAVEDARFLVLRATPGDDGKAALAALARLDPDRPLTGKERLGRADKMVDQGRIDEALAELDLAERAALPPDADELAWARAFARYKARGRYDQAAALFAKIGAKAGPRQAEALYYAARSLSRADHDQEAAVAYRAVARKFSKSGWADESLYLAARLSLLHASWTEASTGYGAYLRKFPNGKQRDAATYERALALLAGGQFAAAKAELHTLAAATSSASEGARLRELEGIAALKSGDKSAALALWNDVVRGSPLSFAASLARQRLLGEGAQAVPAIDPGDARPSDPLPVRLPPIAHLYHRLGLDGDAETYLRAHERDATSDLTGREKEALCAMYGDLGRAARSYRVGVDAVSSATLMHAPSPATEWAWKCVYPRPYLDKVREIEAREALPKGLIYAVMRQESAYDPDALSGARAVGLLQLMPDTARKVAAEGGVPFDEKSLRSPALNIDLGGRYLAKMLRTFKGSAPLAAAAYNAGPRAVRRWAERLKGQDLDVWAALIPFEETRTYVNKVMSNFVRYAYLEGGEAALPEVELALPLGTKEETAEY